MSDVEGLVRLMREAADDLQDKATKTASGTHYTLPAGTIAAMSYAAAVLRGVAASVSDPTPQINVTHGPASFVALQKERDASRELAEGFQQQLVKVWEALGLPTDRHHMSDEVAAQIKALVAERTKPEKEHERITAERLPTTCPRCQRPIQVLRNGLLARHHVSTEYRAQMCPGSFLSPDEAREGGS